MKEEERKGEGRSGDRGCVEMREGQKSARQK